MLGGEEPWTAMTNVRCEGSGTPGHGRLDFLQRRQNGRVSSHYLCSAWIGM